MAKIDYRKLHSLANELFATLNPTNNDKCLVSDNDFFSQRTFENLKSRIQSELRSVRLQLIYPESSGSTAASKAVIKLKTDHVQVSSQPLNQPEGKSDKLIKTSIIRKKRVDFFRASLIYIFPCLVFAAPLVLISRSAAMQKPASKNSPAFATNSATVTSYLESKKRKSHAEEAFALGQHALQQEKVSTALEYFRVAVSLAPANKSFLQSLNDTEKLLTSQKKDNKKTGRPR